VAKQSVKWSEITGYSRNDVKRVPRVLELRLPLLHVRVHRYLGADPSVWFLSCHQLNIVQETLGSKDLEFAKAEALDIVHKHLARMLREVTKVRG
jgi:hypothetical protein